MRNKTLENQIWDEFRKELIGQAVVYGERSSRRVVEFKELDFGIAKELFVESLYKYWKERNGN